MLKTELVAGFIAVVVAAGMPGLALAEGTLAVVVGGEGFDGPPKFSVSFDGKPVGGGAVAKAIDTSKDGRFADAADKSKYVQTFEFKIPDDAFNQQGVVAIKLTNEAHGAAGSKDNRELFVRSVAVNGDTLPASKLGMRSANGIEPTSILGDYVVVSRTAVEGVATAPDGGWPKASVADAGIAPADGAPVKDVVAGSKPTAAADGKPPTMVASADSTKPGTDVATRTDSTVTGATETTPRNVADASPQPEPAKPGPAKTDVVADTDSASANPNPEAGEPVCGINKTFQVTGFNENSNDLTARARKALDIVVKAIGTQRCVVHLTGYSSAEGDQAHNALFSIERSRNALSYLAAQGVKFRRYSANGVGETTQFGASANANRRVVVTVSP